MKTLAIVILVVLLGVSVFYNVSLIFEMSTDPKAKEARFWAQHKNEISMLAFKSGSVEKGVIRDETPEIVLIEYPGGVVDYKKSDIRKIMYNIDRKVEKKAG